MQENAETYGVSIVFESYLLQPVYTDRDAFKAVCHNVLTP